MSTVERCPITWGTDGDNIFKITCIVCNSYVAYSYVDVIRNINSFNELFLVTMIMSLEELGCHHVTPRISKSILDYITNTLVASCRDCKKRTKDMDSYHTSKRDGTILCHECFVIRLAKGQVKEKPEEQECQI